MQDYRPRSTCAAGPGACTPRAGLRYTAAGSCACMCRRYWQPWANLLMKQVKSSTFSTGATVLRSQLA
jgi:hypothetical protein